MASEAVIVRANNLEYRQVTVSDSSAFPKGTVMIIESTPNTANSHGASANQVFVGICAVEKTANDGQTTLPVLVKGDVTAVASGTVTVGNSVALSATANQFRAITALSGLDIFAVCGLALSTASNGNTFTMRLLNRG